MSAPVCSLIVEHLPFMSQVESYPVYHFTGVMPPFDLSWSMPPGWSVV